MSQRLTLDQQKTLIRKHRRGDKRALTQLLESVMPFLNALARKVARQTGATKVEEDLFQEGCLVFCERVEHYNLDSLARVENYAYLWIMSRLKEHACDSLEAVRLPHDALAYKAHREIDLEGQDIDEVAKKRGISRERLESLIRHTVSLPQTLESDLDLTRQEERKYHERMDLISAVFPVLPYKYRRTLANMLTIPEISHRYALARYLDDFRSMSRYAYELFEQEIIHIVRKCTGQAVSLGS